MTTLDTSATIEELLEEFRGSSRTQQLRARLHMIPMVHLFVILGVAVFCMNLVR
jgi:hypothetical protein